MTCSLGAAAYGGRRSVTQAPHGGLVAARPSSQQSKRVIRYSQGLNHSGARTSSESHESLTSEDRVRISTSAVLTVKRAFLKSRSSSSVSSTRPPGEGGGPVEQVFHLVSLLFCQLIRVCRI